MSSGGLNVQYGCGLSCPDGWLNFDTSPTLRLQRLPVIGAFMPGASFPRGVRLGDVVKGLPVASASADRAYCSHVLEHLPLRDMRTALRETLRLLKPGGVFRLVLPDLERLCREYVARAGDPAAAMAFMEASYLGMESRRPGLRGRLVTFLGNSRHQWMWDEPSMSGELASAGFTQIRRASLGDSDDEAFAAVEAENRWNGHLGLHCIKPL
jgi:SAM-dependent methyltransferase